MLPTFQEIDRKRASLGMTPHALCKKARVSPVTYWRWKTGRTGSNKDRTLLRLSAALDGKTPPQVSRDTSLLKNHFHLVAALSAQTAGIPTLDVISVDPTANRPKDLNWLAAMNIRQIAMYVVVTESNIRGADLARAIGCTKQAVSKACRKVEDSRDDPAIDTVLQRVSALLHQGRVSA